MIHYKKLKCVQENLWVLEIARSSHHLSISSWLILVNPWKIVSLGGHPLRFRGVFLHNAVGVIVLQKLWVSCEIVHVVGHPFCHSFANESFKFTDEVVPFSTWWTVLRNLYTRCSYICQLHKKINYSAMSWLLACLVYIWSASLCYPVIFMQWTHCQAASESSRGTTSHSSQDEVWYYIPFGWSMFMVNQWL